MENETDEVVSGVSTLAMAVDQAGPLTFADILDLGAEVAGRLADQHDDGRAHGHVAPGAVVRLDDGPWRLAPAELIPDIEPVPAPELGPDADPTPAADVYALGATLSYGLTGIPVEPADATDPADAGDPAAAAGPEAPPATEGAGAREADPRDLDHDLDHGDLDDAPGPDEPRTIADLAAIDLTDGPETDTGPETDAGPEPDAETEAAPMTLPEVMTSFLVTLRATLAADPSARPSAPDLAATLRQLRSDADTALGGALVGGAAGAVAAVVIGDGAAAEPWGAPLYDTSSVDAATDPSEADVADPAGVPVEPDEAAEPGTLAVEGTGSAASLAAVGASTKKKKSLKERVPVIVATAAVLLAAVLGVSLVRERNDRTSDVLAAGPTVGTQVRRSTTTTMPVIVLEVPLETTTTMVTSSSRVTTTTAPEVVETVPDTTAPTTAPTTTAPPTTAPPTTLPPTTTTTRAPQAGVPVTVVCGTVAIPCPVTGYSEPTTSSDVVRQFSNNTQLTAQCAKDGELVAGSKVWFRIIGQGEFFWIPAAAASASQAPPPCTS